jgi:hypothetical protein
MIYRIFFRSFICRVLAAQKSSHEGYIQRHCGLVNTEAKVKKLKKVLLLSESMVEIAKEHEAAQKKIRQHITYHTMAPAAVSKLETTNGDTTKVTKKELLSILACVFHALEDDKKKKDVLVEYLMKLAEKEPTKLPCLVIPAPRAPQAVPPTHAIIYAATADAEELPIMQLTISSTDAEEVPTMQLSVSSGTCPRSA